MQSALPPNSIAEVVTNPENHSIDMPPYYQRGVWGGVFLNSHTVICYSV